VCQNHRFTYNEPMSCESCTQSLCDLALRFGEGDDDVPVRALSRNLPSMPVGCDHVRNNSTWHGVPRRC
jgi:hypothetical protein